MRTRLWEKFTETAGIIDRFTIGNDKELDMIIAPYDVKASLAHARMLCHTGHISEAELAQLEEGLNEVEALINRGEFKIEEGIEDIHSQIEFYLTERFGETGKKIHTARSRNDQVLTAIKLYLKDALSGIREQSIELIGILRRLAVLNNDTKLPGYTHFQVAMPSSFGNWFGAYADSIEDDLYFIEAAIKVCDKNPLGSAAGFGSSFKIDKGFTTRELGFAGANENPVYAQMTRGKSEKSAAVAIAAIAATLSKLSYDICLYLCQNFAFISFPEELTTGSSIMPHKKNPDVFELTRAKCNLLQNVPNQLTMLINNLPSGYHRDLQLTKQIIFPAVNDISDCLEVMIYALPKMSVSKDILEQDIYRYIGSVEKVDRLVQSGISFRDAYAIIAKQIREGDFETNVTEQPV